MGKPEPGGPNDPQWAWYWREEATFDRSRSYYPGDHYKILQLEEAVEASALRDPDPDYTEEFHEIAQWLPTHIRTPLLRQCRLGRVRQRNKGGIPQTTWVGRVRQGELLIAHLAPTYRQRPTKVAKVVRRCPWPETLQAYLDLGSTSKASKVLREGQTTIHKRVRAIGENEPLVQALLDWRQKDLEARALLRAAARARLNPTGR